MQLAISPIDALRSAAMGGNATMIIAAVNWPRKPEKESEIRMRNLRRLESALVGCEGGSSGLRPFCSWVAMSFCASKWGTPRSADDSEWCVSVSAIVVRIRKGRVRV